MSSKYSVNNSLQHYFISDTNSLLVFLTWDSDSNEDKTLSPQYGGRLDVGTCISIHVKTNKIHVEFTDSTLNLSKPVSQHKCTPLTLIQS